jgi:hypothetical protein
MDKTLADALEVVKRLDPGPEWCSPVSSIAVPVWALRLMVGTLTRPVRVLVCSSDRSGKLSRLVRKALGGESK